MATPSTKPRLTVEVAKVEGLVGIEGKLYVVAELIDANNKPLPSETKKTNAVSSNPQPIWNEALRLAKHCDIYGGEVSKLRLRLYLKKLVGKDVYIVETYIDLAPVIAGGEERGVWYNLTSEGREGGCKIQLSLYVETGLASPPAQPGVMGSLRESFHRPAAIGGESNQPLISRRESDSVTEGLGVDGVTMLISDEGETYADDDPNHLKVTVHKARNLEGKDFAWDQSKKTSDPFCTVKCNGQTFKTQVIERTLDPVWEETFDLAVDYSDACVDFVVEDADPLTNEFLGQISIMLKGLSDKKKVQKWMPLVPVSGKKLSSNCGDILLTLQWFHDPSPSFRDMGKKYSSIISHLGKKIGLVDRESDTEEEGDEKGDKKSSDEDKKKDEKFEIAQKAKFEAEKAEREKLKEALRAELQDMQVKPGDYTAYVHIIEARDLKAEDLSGTSDPVVQVTAFGQTFCTEIKYKCLSCVWDETFIFHMKNLSSDEFESGSFKISVSDADISTLVKMDLIGNHSVDATQIYFRPRHEMRRQWIALFDDENKNDVGVQGYLKMSIAIVGPGDKLHVYDEEEEARKERAAAGEGSLDESAVLLPPGVFVKQEWLVCTIHCALDLPVMDKGMRAGGDFFVTTSCGGSEKSTKRVGKKGENRTKMCPHWRSQLWIPCQLPNSGMARCVVKDFDVVGDSETISTFSVKVKYIESCPDRTIPPMWYNLYGAAITEGGGVAVARAAAIAQGGVNYQKLYDENPNHGSTYKGRVLCSWELAPKLPEKHENEGATPWRRRVKKLSPLLEPVLKEYNLRLFLASGCTLPKSNQIKFFDFNADKLAVCVSCGPYECTSKFQLNKEGSVEWYEVLEVPGIMMPDDSDQVPDVFIHLLRSEKDHVPICFLRIPAKELLESNFSAATAQWMLLKEDKSLYELPKGTFPGSLLVKIALGDKKEFNASKAQWQQECTAAQGKEKYRVLAHIYQANNCPSSDSNGLLDPYVVIDLQGKQFNSEKFESPKNHYPYLKRQTVDPQWYMTWDQEIEMPPRHMTQFFPQVALRLFDWDRFDDDDPCGNVLIPLSNFPVLEAEPQVRTPPKPKWYSFFIEQPGDSSGEILCSFQVISLAGWGGFGLPPVPDIKPPFRPAYVEIIALGLRGMQPFNMIPLQMPCVELEIASPGADVKACTRNSRKPTGTDPNFMQRIVMKLQLPDDEVFAPRMKIVARDSRLGGFMKPIVAVGACDLSTKLPWTPSYEAPRINVHHELESQPAIAPLADLPPVRDVVETIRANIGAEDSGTGVFPAIHHMPGAGAALERVAGNAKQMVGNDAVNANDDEDEEEGPPKYLIGRDKLTKELEEQMKIGPFETYELFRGQKMIAGDYKCVGKFKCIIRVTETDPDKTPMFENPEMMDNLLKPQLFKIRLYCLKVHNLTPMDLGIGGKPGKSDPYLKVTLGKKVFNDRKNYIEDATEAFLHKYVEFSTELPGTGQLKIEIMDYDDVGVDDLIGRTIIDLEDRWFDATWQSLGMHNRQADEKATTGLRFQTKPLELRTLTVPTSLAPQGHLECWVDILPVHDDRRFLPDDVSLPPSGNFEVRVVIWGCKGMPAMDTLENMNDLFVRAWMEGAHPQETDTHWRSKKGKGSFNWRMKFPVELGPRSRLTKFPYLTIQTWDRDIIKWNDCIAEGQVDLGKTLRKAYRKRELVKAFLPPKSREQLVAQRTAIIQQQNATAAPGTQPVTAGVTASPASGSAVSGDAEAKKKAAEDDDAKFFIRQVKTNMGFSEEDPPESSWVKMDRADRVTGGRIPMGQCLISVQVLPIDKAEQQPVGRGREEPNSNPFLPPPVGRLKFSWNPFVMISELVGPELCWKLSCVCCCLVLIAILYCIQPILNFIVIAQG